MAPVASFLLAQPLRGSGTASTVHKQCAAQVKRAVNVGLIVRNWVIGHIFANTSETEPIERSVERLCSKSLPKVQKRGIAANGRAEAAVVSAFLHDASRDSPSPEMGVPLSTL